MGNEGLAFTIGLSLGAAFIVIMSGIFVEYSTFYKSGQIDALTGRVLFELKDQPDGTRVWVRK